ncbi:hypothetical protein MHYP_G00190490 [Metynnis hypsauchen]
MHQRGQPWMRFNRVHQRLRRPAHPQPALDGSSLLPCGHPWLHTPGAVMRRAQRGVRHSLACPLKTRGCLPSECEHGEDSSMRRRWRRECHFTGALHCQITLQNRFYKESTGSTREKAGNKQNSLSSGMKEGVKCSLWE